MTSDGCFCFDESSSKRTRVEMCNYYSVYGKVKPVKIRSIRTKHPMVLKQIIPFVDAPSYQIQ